jgi:2-phospho-L-lactate transferase/gluconeogenesis factor (CofD/UPF0052 family)
VWANALDHRFSGGELAGHSLGNLVLVGLSQTLGDFAEATAHVAALLGVTARVLPATSAAVDLCAETGEDAEPGEGVGDGADFADGEDVADGRVKGPRAEYSRTLVGQALIAHSTERARRVWLRPERPAVPDEVLAAIAVADQVVLGPGSLFTSVLAVCAVTAIRDALAARTEGRIYVCNLGPREPETSGFGADDHLRALADHGVAVDTVVCDPATQVGVPSLAGLSWTGGLDAGAALSVVQARVARPNGHTHDPALLAGVLEALSGAVQGV